MKFQKAERRRAKARVAITGPSGSGKTYSALLLARGLTDGRIAVVDTERGSASLYADLAEYDTLEFASPYSPERYAEAIGAAAEAGYSVVILDSITPEWSGVGGCLEISEQIARSKYRGNSWSAWSDVTPRHRAFLDAINNAPMHIIATMRSKTETAQTEEGGKKRVVKLGMKAEQREGAEYEFTTVFDLVHDGHYATVSKDRTGLFRGDPQPIATATGKMLRDWLESGAEPAPEAGHASDVPDPTPSLPPNMPAHEEAALAAARNGIVVFKAYWKATDIAVREALRPNLEHFQKLCKDADQARAEAEARQSGPLSGVSQAEFVAQRADMTEAGK